MPTWNVQCPYDFSIVLVLTLGCPYEKWCWQLWEMISYTEKFKVYIIICVANLSILDMGRCLYLVNYGYLWYMFCTDMDIWLNYIQSGVHSKEFTQSTTEDKTPSPSTYKMHACVSRVWGGGRDIIYKACTLDLFPVWFIWFCVFNLKMLFIIFL